MKDLLAEGLLEAQIEANEETIAALKARIAELEKLDREAATHVESLICLRTDFTGEPPHVGWKGLGLALKEHLDKQDARIAELEKNHVPEDVAKFDCTSYPSLEQQAIKIACRIAGLEGQKPNLPDPVQVLEDAESLFKCGMNDYRAMLAARGK